MRSCGEPLGVPGFVSLLRIIALVPLFFFGEFSLFCGAYALAHAVRDTGSALMFGGVALVSTLGYPALVEFERRISLGSQSPPAPWPLATYDAFFLGGGMFATWKLDGRPGAPPLVELLPLAFVLWIIAGAVTRRRLAAVETGGPRPSSKGR